MDTKSTINKKVEYIENKNLITVCTVNYNSADFIELMLFSLQQLTCFPYSVVIRDNSSSLKDYRKLQRIVKQYQNVSLYRIETPLRGSMAHGEALNELAKKIETKYGVVIEADVSFLRYHWDKVLIEMLNDKVPIIGTQADFGPKPQDFPLMFAVLFKTDIFKSLDIDFRPRNISLSEDTGWELREKYKQAGFECKLLYNINTRVYKDATFKDVPGCTEFYIDKEYKTPIFASHFGRGSDPRAKVLFGIKFNGKFLFFNFINYFLKYVNILYWRRDKKKWIGICGSIVVEECIQNIGDHYEILKRCPYCFSEKLIVLFNSKDYYSGKSGIFFISECSICGLVFQNPRIKESFIGNFYSDDLGYYNPTVPMKLVAVSLKRKFRRWLRKQAMINHFGYTNFGKKVFLKKLLSWPLAPLLYHNLTPKYISHGRLLEIGCSHGEKLEQYKKDGWDVSGIEINSKSARYAEEVRGIKVEQKRIEEMNFPDGIFDVIVMNMVLEHLYEPFNTLRSITKWLKSGGQLIFSIPYFNGIEFKIYKKYAYPLHLPYHITFFSRKIFQEFFKANGYSKIKFYFQMFDRDMVASAYYKYQDTGSLFWKFIAYNKYLRVFFIRPLVFVLSIFRKTSRVSTYVYKK